jgi:hypothetical protein
LSIETIERRACTREPVDTRIFASIDGQTVRLDNISEQGVAIHGHGLSPGSQHLLEINIDHNHVTLSVQIVDTSHDNTLHARFVDMPYDAHQLICSYIAALS